MELARLIEHLIKDLKGPEYVKPFLSALYWECAGWKEWMLPIVTYEQMSSDWLLPVLAYVVNQLCALIGPTMLHHFVNTFLNLDRFEIFEASAVEEETSAEQAVHAADNDHELPPQVLLMKTIETARAVLT